MKHIFGYDHHQNPSPWDDAPPWAIELGLAMARILDNQETFMAAVDDELAAIKASLDLIQTGVTALLAKIAAMPTAGLTPAQQTALDAIAAEAQGIATAANPA
jgi:hypothetical protein